eukprot:14371566-Ditylum_brightwellii.AAC.1
MMHQEHDVGEEGGGGYMGGMMVQQKANTVASKGRSLPLYPKGGGLCVLTCGVVKISTKKDVSVVIATTVAFVAFVKKQQSLLYVIGSSTIHPSPRPNIGYLWEPTDKLLFDS